MMKRSKGLKRTPLKRMSNKRKEKLEAEKQQLIDDKKFYMEIWSERPHVCSCCNKYLGKEPLTVYFDHILEKSKYPELRHNKLNIWLLCMECHDNKSRGNLNDCMKEKILQTEGLVG